MDFSALQTILSKTEVSTQNKLQMICQFLNEQSNKYTWVGFYFMNNAWRTLHLGPFIGEPTEHLVIPYGKGICGQVAESGLNFLSNDVAAEDNYIACSVDVKSEIVVPLYVHEKLVAQLDIDSNEPQAFNESDVQNLEALCQKLAENMGEELLTLQRELIN